MTTDNPTVTPWRIGPTDYPESGSLHERMRFLLRYAALAPSSHNTEPWRFRVQDNQIDVLIDFSRWLKVADDDQRELHISVGCALENLLIAVEHFGLGHNVEYLPNYEDSSLAASVTLSEPSEPSSIRPPILFEMITVRHTNHQAYESRPVPQEILERFQSLCVEDGLHLFLTSDPDTKPAGR